MKRIIKAIGCLLAALGWGIVIFGLLAIIDPQGAQLANDADPFGTPPSMPSLLIQVGTGAVLLALGLWLVLRKAQVQRDAPEVDAHQTGGQAP